MKREKSVIFYFVVGMKGRQKKNNNKKSWILFSTSFFLKENWRNYKIVSLAHALRVMNTWLVPLKRRRKIQLFNRVKIKINQLQGKKRFDPYVHISLSVGKPQGQTINLNISNLSSHFLQTKFPKCLIPHHFKDADISSNLGFVWILFILLKIENWKVIAENIVAK